MHNLTKKWLSIIVIALGVMDAITVIGSLAVGSSEQSALAQDTGLTGNELKLAFGIVIIIYAFIAISIIYAGIQGLGVTKGKEVSKYTRIFTNIILFLTGISNVFGLVSLLQGSLKVTNFLSPLCSFIIWLSFRLIVLKKEDK